MAYKYDAEKERLVKIAQNQNYQGPTEEIKINSVIFEETTRKITIFYTVIKGKRTVEKKFSYCGNSYKLYSNWKYTQTEKQKKLTLTNEVLEQLNTNTDEIIKNAIPLIFEKIPHNLFPSWYLKSQIEKKYSIMERTQLQKIEETLGMKKNNSLQELEYVRRKIKENFNTKKDLEDQNKNVECSIKYRQEYIEKQERRIFRFLFSRKIKFYQKNILEYQNSIGLNLRKIDEAEEELKRLDFLLLSCQEEYDKNIKNYLEKISEVKENIKNKLESELSLITPLSTQKLTSTSTTNGATQNFIKEERNKMNRIYKDGKTLRQWILFRDDYTCKKCGNSIKKEPNLLLEVDHIHPVSKWGPSVPENLETLCWKCNRKKSDK